MLPRLAWRLQDWEDLVNCTHYSRSEYDLYGDSKWARGTEAQGGGDSGSGEGAHPWLDWIYASPIKSYLGVFFAHLICFSEVNELDFVTAMI